MNQPFKRFKEQEMIISSRMSIDKDTISILKRFNYYSIINFYKAPFLEKNKNLRGKDKYIENFKFKYLKSLHDFDRELRILFFDNLTLLESFFKTAISYYFSETNGILKKNSYLLLENYNTGKKNSNILKISMVVNTLKKIKKDNEKMIIRHYNTTKDNIPFWIIIHYLTFGDISKLYSCLHKNVYDKICDHFKNLYKEEYGNLPNITHSFVRTYLVASSHFRNVAAHNERLYEFSSRETVNIKRVSDMTSNRNQKLFTIYEGLKLFLSKEEFDALTEKLKLIIKTLEDKLENIININDILSRMDFPNDWHKN